MFNNKDQIKHVDELLNKAELLMNDGNFEGALEYFNEAFNKGIEIEYMAGVARALEDIGYIHQLKKEYDEAFECFEKAAEIWDKMGHPLGVAIILNNLSCIFHERNQKDNAIAYLNKAIEIKRNHDSEASLAKSLNNMGNYLEELGKVEESIEYYTEAIELKLKTETIDKELKNSDTGLATIGLIFKVAQICDSLADNYKKKNQFNVALKYNAKSMEMHKIMETNKFIGGLAECYYKRAEIFFLQKYYNKSMELYEKYIEYLDDQHDYPKGRLVALANMGLIYKLKSDYDKALEFYKNAFEIAEGLLDDEWISKIQNSMEELNRIKSKKDL